MSGLFPLRPLQQKALDGLRDSLRSGHRRPIIQAATGFGKTIVAAHMVQGALDKRKRVAFVVPMITLIDQTFERFETNGIEPGDMGVMQGNHPWHRPNAPVQICSVQTIAARGAPEVDFTIVDEVHLRFKAIEEWIKAEPNKIFVGLSATPWARGLKEFWDDLIIPTSISELIEQGYLSPFKAFASAHPDLTGIKTIAGDYHEGQLSERMSKTSIVADVVKTWLEKAERRPTLVFAVDRAHAQLLHEQFGEAGVSSAYVDANTPREERHELGRWLNTGDLEVICSVGTMTHGVDLDVRCIVLARPTKSEILFVQMVGRGLRTAEGKDHCIVLDHSDTHLRLGMVTDIHHDGLMGGKNDRVGALEHKAPLPKDCPKCAFLVPVGLSECPNCGFKRKRVCSVVQKEGELVELTMVRKLKRKIEGALSLEEQIAFYGELQGYAQEFGYKSGWAANKFREKCGVWPNDPQIRYVRPRPTSPGVRSWIRAGQIRFARSRQRRSDDEIIRDSIAGFSEV